MAWNYERQEQRFEAVPVGKHRIRIKSAEKAISKSSSNDMLALQFEVSGSNQILYHYITFLDDRPEITNRMLTQFFDSFKDIEDGNFNLNSWIGKVGACMVKHDEEDIARISYFISADKQDSIPAWKEPSGTRTGTSTKSSSVPDIGSEDLPF